jgi:hypothetical protein
VKKGKPKKRASKAHNIPKRPSDVFDEREKRIKQTRAWLDALAQKDPQWAAIYACQHLEIGTETLLKLIESKKLTNAGAFHDDAESRLCGYFQRLIYELCRLVKIGREDSVFVAWRGAAELSKAIHDLALTASPADESMFSLQKIAGREIYMPSLRAKGKKFDYDFKEVADKIGLSLQSAVNTGWTLTPEGFKSDDGKAKYSLDSLATQFVVAFIENVAHFQSITRESEAWLRGLRERHPNSPEYKQSLADFLRRKYSDEQVSELMACHALPVFHRAIFDKPKQLEKLWRDTVDQFWKQALKPHLKKRETLNQFRGTPFYKQICKCRAAQKRVRVLCGFDGEKKCYKSNTSNPDYKVKAELIKRCEQALKSKSLFRPPEILPRP